MTSAQLHHIGHDNAHPEKQHIPACTISVVVWQISVGAAKEHINALKPYLSAFELQRHSRFISQDHKTTYLVAHGALRLILATYLDLPLSRLNFASSLEGKPYLIADGYSAPLHFNLTHSADLVLIAITTGHEVGIDVELLNSDIDVLSIARNTFSPVEQRRLRKLPEHLRTERFFRLWTELEAVSKVSGTGISFGEFLCAERAVASPEAGKAHQVASFRPAPKYVAALAIRRFENSLHLLNIRRVMMTPFMWRFLLQRAAVVQ